MSASNYPESPGAKDRDTSHEAAAAIADETSLLRARALTTLKRHGALTADEVASHMGETVLSVRPRITELSQLGQVRDSGERRPNISGRNAIVWKVTAA